MQSVWPPAPISFTFSPYKTQKPGPTKEQLHPPAAALATAIPLSLWSRLFRVPHVSGITPCLTLCSTFTFPKHSLVLLCAENGLLRFLHVAVY